MVLKLFNLCYILLFIILLPSLLKSQDSSISEMKSIPWLPDPLMLKNNTPIENKKQWAEQKAWFKEQLQKYYLGEMPPIPKKVKSTVLEEKIDGEITIKKVKIDFGKDYKASLTLELYYPTDIKERKPVFMTQWNHREWLGIGVKRGYIGCLYAAADVKDDTKTYKELYPDFSFKRLMQRAWAATAVVTYLHTQEMIDTNKIAISGHSRNGKQSLFATAFDDRIDAVIPSSSGFGGVRPARISDRRFGPHTMGHTFNDFPDWFLHSLKKYVGHEDRLPVDMNSLLAAVAPRPCLLNAGFTTFMAIHGGLKKHITPQKKPISF